MLRDAKIPAEQCLSRSCAQADNHLRPKCADFGVKPWATRGKFRCVRFLMDAPLPSRLPLEMFHRICNVGFPAVDSGFEESGIEQFAGGTDKRFASRSSWLPGCSPTNRILASASPSPNTVCVARFQRSQALQSLAAFSSSSIVLFGGIGVFVELGGGVSSRWLDAQRIWPVSVRRIHTKKDLPWT